MEMEGESKSSLQLTIPFEAMYIEGADGFYYSTEWEWEDHHRFLGLDAPHVHYTTATQNEHLPYVYYTPTFGYSPYFMGVDGPQQHYFALPPHQNQTDISSYVPLLLHPDTILTTPPDSLFTSAAQLSNSNNFNSTSPSFPNSTKSPSTSRGSKSTVGPSNQAAAKGSNNPAGGFPSPPSSHLLQGRNSFGSIQAVESLPNGRITSHHNQLKINKPSGSGISDFGPSNHGRATVAKLPPKLHVGNGPDSLVEQSQGPGINRPKNELAVTAYTTRAGGTNGQGNIVIYTDQFNQDDFPVEYTDAKFFVIKSYSEDDVHKSIKYNVWSSTPHGNKKLSSAFEDAQRVAAHMPRGCPIFLFFSVNVSGQFCGVAEMIGPVDFNKDMDFWQQDKWNGSFAVKWHIIKDVPNTSLRHIILENNENKPVTNSRDTQEIMYEKGLEMLKIFKNYASKTSLFDDFMYYETRQKIIEEEKGRLHGRSYESPLFVPASGPPRKLNSVVQIPPNKVENAYKHNGPNSSKKTVTSTTEEVFSQSNITNSNEQTGVEAEYDVSSLKVGTLSINPERSDHTSFGTDMEPFGLKAGSVPLKFDGSGDTSGFLTVGTIPLDPKALLLKKGKGVPIASKKGSQQK